MKLKKLSATFDDREHGEKARPLGPEVKKRDVTAARDDYSSYLLSNQQANQQQDDDDVIPPPIPDPQEQEPPQLPESYRQAIDAFENAIALQGGNMDTSGDGTLDILDVAGIIDFFMTVVGQGVFEGGSNPIGGLQGLFWNSDAYQNAFDLGTGLFYNPGVNYGDGATYYSETEDGIAESLLTWADYMAAQDDADANVSGFLPIPINWVNWIDTSSYSSALDAVFDAYQGDVPEDFFDTLLMNPQPTEADLEDLGAWFDANMLPIMNIYADVYMLNATGDSLGYSDGNFQDMMDFIETQGSGLGFFDVSVNDTDYNPFSGNIFDVNNDGTFNGADIAAWADFTEMVSAVSGGGTISETNNLFSQADIDQIIEYYTYYGAEMAGGNMYFSANGEWDNTQNLFNINNVAENPPLIFNLLDSGDVDAYIDEQDQDEILALIQLSWADQRPVWGEAYGLSAGLQSLTPEWYTAFANSIQPWINNGYDPDYSQQGGASWATWAASSDFVYQATSFTQQVASWVGQNLFDPDGDGQYDPSELDQSVVDYLIMFHSGVNSVADITPELFNVFTVGDPQSFGDNFSAGGTDALNLQIMGVYLLQQLPDWVSSVGGIPDFANILGQEPGETYNYNAQTAAFALLAQVFGHQSQSNTGFTATFGTNSSYLSQDLSELFQYLGFSSSEAGELENYMLDADNGFLNDNQLFANWLYAGFQGFIGFTDPNTGQQQIIPQGEGVIWAPAGWEPGDDYFDYAYYQSEGPYGFDVQFYNFDVDLTSSDFLYSYNNFGDSTLFFVPPPPPNFIQDPSEGVEGIYGSGATPGAQEAGEYIDLPDFLNRTGGMIDFDGDGDVGLSDFFALHGWLMTGGYNNYQVVGEGSGWNNSTVFLDFGIGWSAFYGLQTDSVNQGMYNISSADLWYGGLLTPSNQVVGVQGQLSNPIYSYSGENPFMYQGAAFGESGQYTGYDPAYALAHFLVFQYANDYVSSGGQTPEWFTTLMGSDPNTFMAAADWFNMIDPDWVNASDAIGAGTFAGDDATIQGGLMGSIIVPLLQAILPDELAMNSYSEFYLQNGIDPNQFFAPAGPYTGPDSLVPIVTGMGSLGSGLEEALGTASSANFISEYAMSNPAAIASIDFNGDGQIDEAEINLYGQLYNLIDEAGIGFGPTGPGSDAINLGSMAMELMGAGAAAFNLVNQYIVGQIMTNPDVNTEQGALYTLFEPFIQLGLFGLDTEVDAGGNVQYYITVPVSNFTNISSVEYVAQVFGNPNQFITEGLIGVIADSLIDGAYYLGPDGNYIQVNNVYAGLAAQNFYTNLNQYNSTGTYSDFENIEFTVLLNYPELIEFAEQYGGPDLNGDGFYTQADIEMFFDIVGSQNVAPGTAEFNALDLNNDGLLTIADYAQFNAFFGSFEGGAAGLNIGAYGYFNDGIWVDFDYDDLGPEDYFGSGWTPQGYNTGNTPPPPTT